MPISVEDTIKTIGAAIPSRWRVSAVATPLAARGQGIDGLAKIAAPDGRSAWMLFEVRNVIEPRDVGPLARQLSEYQQLTGKRKAIRIVVAPYLTRRTRDRLADAGLSYIDLTGNLRLTADEPALFVAMAGAEKNPLRNRPPRRSLRGPKAARIVRMLCDRRQPWGVRELANATGTNPGYVSRIIDLLDREGLIKRVRGRGPIADVDWEGLIRRWAEDFSPFQNDRSTSYLAPRGLPSIVERLRNADFSYAITGSYGASKLAPITVPRLLTCYADDRSRAAKALDLREAEQGVNVILLQPFDPIIYDRTWHRDDLRFVSPVQLAADLLTSSGRGPSEAEALLAWMKGNENVWRH